MPAATAKFTMLILLACAGCGWLPVLETEPLPASAALSVPPTNPILIPADDRELTWNTIVDTIDDYFDIATEQRVHLMGNTLTDGHIITTPQPGAGIQEFWRKDSTPGFETWHSTFQSVRRRAEVQVAPRGRDYAVQVTVYKELEDLDRPEQAAVGLNLRRHDGGIVRQSSRPKAGPQFLGWIPLGRDVSLEQAILADLRNRFYRVAPPAEVELLPPALPSVDLRH